MKVNKNKILVNTIVSALVFIPSALFALTPSATGSFTVSATVNTDLGIVCNGTFTPGTGGNQCSLAANFGANNANYYTTAANSQYFKATFATNSSTPGSTPLYYSVTDTSNTGAVACDGASGAANCFYMKGSNSTSNHLPFSIAYQACGTSSYNVFSPGSAPVGVAVANSSITAGNDCSNIAASDGSMSTTSPGANLGYGVIQISVPQQANAPVPDTYSDSTVVVNVCSTQAACV